MQKEIDIKGLPQELVSQLRLNTQKETIQGKFSHQITEILTEHDGTASLDEILVAYWRKTQVVLKRSICLSRMDKMKRDGIVVSAGTQQRAVYRLKDSPPLPGGGE